MLERLWGAFPAAAVIEAADVPPGTPLSSRRSDAPETRQTSQRLSAAPSEGVMLAVTGTGLRSRRGGFAKPTTPNTCCHQEGARAAISVVER